MTTPTSRITFPVDGSFIGAVPYIDGTADDRYAGVSPRDFEAGISTTATNAVEVAIRKRAGCGAQECWWNGAGWADSAVVLWSSAVFTGASSGTWRYNLPGGTIANGTTYYALSRVRDIVANLQTVYATNYFTGDTTPPASQAASPRGTVESVNTISGTAQDTLPGELKTSGVVKISIKQTTEGGFAANKCYDSATSGFIACPGGGYPNNRLWLSTGTTADPSGQPAARTWDTSGINWNNQSDYNVIALAIDKADNQKPYGTETADTIFYVQTPVPVIVISAPAGADGAPYKASGVPNVSGSSTNLRAVDSVLVRLKRLIGSTSWWYQPSQQWVNGDTYTWVDHSGGNWSQSISAAAAFTMDNASYTISAVGFNAVGNPGSKEKLIVIDNTLPAGFIAAPNMPYVNLMPTISGTAADPGNIRMPADFDGNIYLRIKDVENGYYWRGSSFSVTVTDLDLWPYTAAPTVNWSTATLVNTGLKDGRRYRVLLFPKDKAGNVEQNEGAMTAYQVLFDTSLPNSGIGYPGNRYVYRTLAPSTGTALDPPGSNPPSYRSDLDRVELQIYYPDGPKYWNGSAFSSNVSSFNIVNGTDTWSYAPPLLQDALGTGKYYVMQTRAVDRAGNIQNGFMDGVSTITFICDKTPPTSTIIQPINTGKYKPAGLVGVSALNGSAADAPLPFSPEQLNSVQINLGYLQGSVTYYWAGSAFSSWTVTEATAWQTATGTAPWNYPFGETDWISDRNYTLMVRAFDKAEPVDANGGNMQDPPTIYNFVVDGTPPVSRISTPTAGSFIQNSIPVISGTSYGGVSGLNVSTSGLKIAISYIAGTDTWYWNGETALGTRWSSPTLVELPVNFTASASTITWSYPKAGFELPVISINNQIYTLAIAGLDQAGNQETWGSISVTSDFNYPIITISTPMAGANAFYGAVRPITSLTGAASDSPADIVPPVKAEIRRSIPPAPWNQVERLPWAWRSTWLAVVARWLGYRRAFVQPTGPTSATR